MKKKISNYVESVSDPQLKSMISTFAHSVFLSINDVIVQVNYFETKIMLLKKNTLSWVMPRIKGHNFVVAIKKAHII